MAEKGCDVGAARTYDLLERTARFAEAVVLFAKKIPRNPVTLPLIRQLVRAGTSVGANNCEANDAVSKKDFRNRLGICKKEASETKYWLRIMAKAEPRLKQEARRLWREANELHLIFGKSFQTAGRKKNDE
jgi:four helix bundle protein